MTPAIAVIGAGAADASLDTRAAAVGRVVADRGVLLVCGGLGGIMEVASRAARERGGSVLGVLPGYDRAAANPWVDVVVATGMGHARNAIVVASADAVVALPGEAGTLSEVGLALKLGRPVVGLDAWYDIPGVEVIRDPEEAVDRALELAGLSRHRRGVRNRGGAKVEREPPS